MFIFWKRKAACSLFVFVLFCVFTLSTLPCHAEQPPQHFVRERLASCRKNIIDLNCVPQFAPEKFPFLTLEAVDLLEKEGIIREFFAKHGYQKEGLTWRLQFDCKEFFDEELVYECEDWRYGFPQYGEHRPRTPIDRSKEKYLRAEALVLAFLKELDLDFEYPFYRVDDYEPGRGEEMAIPVIEVSVRLRVEGLPFDPGTNYYPQKCPEDKNPFSEFALNPFATFQVSEDGKFLSAVLSKVLKVVDIKEDRIPLLGWRELLERYMYVFSEKVAYDYNSDLENYFSIEQVELVGMLDKGDKFYPAWLYTVYLYVDGEKTDTLHFCFDARTGRRVDYHEY